MKVSIHGVGGVGLGGVGCEARAAGLNGLAVDALAARVVYVAPQRGVAGIRLRHAPLLAGVTSCRRWDTLHIPLNLN